MGRRFYEQRWPSWSRRISLIRFCDPGCPICLRRSGVTHKPYRRPAPDRTRWFKVD